MREGIFFSDSLINLLIAVVLEELILKLLSVVSLTFNLHLALVLRKLVVAAPARLL